jgi:hypothetical protein
MDRTDSPHNYGQLIFDKNATNIQWRKSYLFNKQFRNNWIATDRRMRERETKKEK